MTTLFVPGLPPVLIGNVWYNVKDSRFGAKGDGTTDDNAAVQAAIDAATAAGGGEVFLPPGTYKCATTHNQVIGGSSNQGYHLWLKDKVRLRGAGRGVTIIKGTALQQNPIFSWQNTGVALRDLTINATGLDNADPIKLILNTHCELDNVEVIGGAYGLQLIGCQDIEWANVYAHNQAQSSGGDGGYGISIVDFDSVGATGTARIRGRSATVSNTAFGALRIEGDTATPGGVQPEDVAIAQVHALSCGTGAASQYGAFRVNYVDGASLEDCVARACNLGFDLTGGFIAVRLLGCLAVGNQYQGFRTLGASGNAFSGCKAFDNNILAAGPTSGSSGFSLQDNGAVGSTYNILTGCAARNRATSGKQFYGYVCSDPNSGLNIITGCDWHTAIGSNASYKATDVHAGNIDS